MSTLTGKKIKDTYDGLIKTSNEEKIPSTGQSLLEDGLGFDSAISMGRVDNGVSVTGELTVTNTDANITGKLGVNTSDPAEVLDVKTEKGSVRIKEAGDFGTQVNFRHTNGTQTASFENNGSTNQFMVFRVNGTDNTNGQIRFVTNDVEGFRVDENQRVGIGIEQPTAKLHVEAGITEDIKLNVEEGDVRIGSSTSNGSLFVTSFNTVTMNPENALNFGPNFYVDYADNHVGFGTNNPNDFVQIVGDTGAKIELSNVDEDNALSVKPNSSTDTKFTVNRDNGTGIILQASNTGGTVANDIKINPFGGDLFVGEKPADDTFSNGGAIKFDVGDYEGNPRIVTLQSKASSVEGGGFQFKSNNLNLFSILPDDDGNVAYNFGSIDSFTVNAQTNLTLSGDEGVTISSNSDETFLLKEGGTTFLQTKVDQFGDDGLGCETTSLKTGRFGITALSTPASSTATGTTGEIRVDANYIYVCTATNTWKRTQINTW